MIARRLALGSLLALTVLAGCSTPPPPKPLVPRVQVVLLPQESKVNVNTASATVIWAAVEGMDFATAQQIAQLRLNKAFESSAELQQRFSSNTALNNANAVLDVKSVYFEVWARLRFDDLVVQEKSLVYRQGLNVTTVVRERGAALATSLMGDGSANPVAAR